MNHVFPSTDNDKLDKIASIRLEEVDLTPIPDVWMMPLARKPQFFVFRKFLLTYWTNQAKILSDDFT